MEVNQSNELEDAAAQAAGRGLATVLQRNPLVAFAAALIGPIFGLLRHRRPPAPTSISRLKLESYRSMSGPASTSQDPARIQPASPEEPADAEVAPASPPSRTRPRRRPVVQRSGRAARRVRLTAQKGGYDHGQG